MSSLSSLQQKLEHLLGPRRALHDPDLREPYSRDESGLGNYPPDAVALVESVEEAQEVLKLAALDKIPIVPRGAGTGMTGGALAMAGGIVLSTERMTRIREIDEANLLAVVEPGVITGQFQQAVEERKLFYPPDPASLESCSLGGNVAENAGGPRAFKYGVTREYVLGLELGLIGGKVIRVGRRTVKGVTGLDLVSLVVGSEGTLALVTEITLKLLALPPAVSTFMVQFPSAVSAAEAVTNIIRRGYRPRVLEFLDPQVLLHLRHKGTWPIPAQAAALLLVELDGEAESLEKQLIEVAEVCERAGALDISVATDEARRRQMWDMRRQVSPVLRDAHRFKVSEDIVVPRAYIPEMVHRLEALAATHQVTIASFGHAGDGNLHVNVLFDEPEVYQRLDFVLTDIFKNALALGGTLSGEHGIGMAKKRFMPLEQHQDLLDLQKRIKQAFDPWGLMNPKKMLP